MHVLPIGLDHDKCYKRSRRHSMGSLIHAQRPCLSLSPPPHRHAGHDRGHDIHSCYCWTRSQDEENQAHESETPLRCTFKAGEVFVSIRNIWNTKKISLKTLLLQELRLHYATLWVWIMENDKSHLSKTRRVYAKSWTSSGRRSFRTINYTGHLRLTTSALGWRREVGAVSGMSSGWSSTIARVPRVTDSRQREAGRRSKLVTDSSISAVQV